MLAIGGIAAALLEQFGVVAFKLAADGRLVQLDPSSVAVLYDESMLPQGKRARRGRPIVTDGKPQHVLYEDGVFYEVIFEDANENPD